MKAPLSWMRDFVKVPSDARQVASRLAGVGFEVAEVAGDVVDFEITANRPDCLSVYGLAREAATAYSLSLAAPALAEAAAAGTAPVRVSIGDAGCARYALAVFDVRVGPSPSWLTDRLVAAGARPINNIVDITNYVMLELGHPMHAFDAAKLAGPEIRVRRAKPGEPLTTLDGEARELDETMLVIADRERAVAIAGVMGGAATEVSGTTSRIALESAWFLPATVRATSRRLGLKTEASARFERGADWAAPVVAIRRAHALLQQIGAGQIAGGITDVHPRPMEPRRVPLRRSRIPLLLGTAVPDADVERLLTGLGFRLTANSTGWEAVVPSFRVDVAREADLIEEVGRHWGFDRVAATFPALRTLPRKTSPSVDRDRRLRRVLCAAGLQEAQTFTFIEPAAATPFAATADDVVPIANPLSEKFAVLRPSLLPGLLDAVAYNRRREATDVRLFETGAVFRTTGEERRAAWVITGAQQDHWSVPPADLDVYDGLGIAEVVGEALNVAVRTATADDGATGFVRGRYAHVVAGPADTPVVVGAVGEVRAEVASARGVPAGTTVVAGEVVLDRLAALDASTGLAVAALPRHPSIVRDLAIIVSDRLPAAEVRGTIRSHAPATLVSIREFDRYQGAGLPPGHVSLAVRLVFRDPDRTLTDAEVQQSVEAIVAALERAHGATLRGGERQQ